MGALHQAFKIISEVQTKRINEKITRKINFPTYKTHFFLDLI
jgi:hypothetical protein